MSVERVYIFGGGAAGANVLLNLLYTLPAPSYAVIDFDTVEQRNITAGTQPYTRTDINRPKVQALQRIANTLTGKLVIAEARKMLTAKDIRDIVVSPATALLVDAFDNASSRNLFLSLGKSFNVLHVGFSATLSGEAVWNESYTKMVESKSDAAIDVCQMHLARPFIMALSSIAAIVAADFAETGTKRNVYFDKSFKVITF